VFKTQELKQALYGKCLTYSSVSTCRELKSTACWRSCSNCLMRQVTASASALLPALRNSLNSCSFSWTNLNLPSDVSLRDVVPC